MFAYYVLGRFGRSPPRRGYTADLRIIDKVKAVATEAGATPAQIALAWLLAQGEYIAPIPDTKRSSASRRTSPADSIELSAEQTERLNNLTPAAGERHDERSGGDRPLTAQVCGWGERPLSVISAVCSEIAY